MPETNRSTLTSCQREVFDKISALRKYTLSTGFKTTRSQNEILSRLNADDLAAVLLALEGGAQ